MRPIVTGDAAFAVGDALTWNTIAGKQWVRVLGAPSEYDRQLDLYLLAFALRNVLRAAEAARKVAERLGDSVAAARLQEAVDAFEERVPDGKHVRDILEHFDDYRAGEGFLQRKRLMDAGLLEWVEEADSGPVLVVGGSFRLHASQAVAAANWLTSEVAEAFHGRQDPPRA